MDYTRRAFINKAACIVGVATAATPLTSAATQTPTQPSVPDGGYLPYWSDPNNIRLVGWDGTRLVVLD